MKWVYALIMVGLLILAYGYVKGMADFIQENHTEQDKVIQSILK